MSNSNEQNHSDAKAEVSLLEELQAITEQLTGAESDADVEKGLARLRHLRTEHSPGTEAARKRAEELISRAEDRLEKLRRYLAHKRRLQEGELMAKVSAEREANEALIASAAAAVFTPAREGFMQEKDRQAADPAPEGSRGAEQPAPKTRPKPRTEQAVNAQPAHAEPSVNAQPNEIKPAEFEWNKSYRIAAHMAASYLEDGKFFEKLRRDVKKAGEARPAPKDDNTAESHFKAVHALNVRLINIELKVKATAEAYKKNEPVAQNIKSASNEIKGFMRDFIRSKAERPEMADEYERLFGGYAEKYASMEPNKGGGILDSCLAEQRNAELPAAGRADDQRVLVRNDQ